jgi:hypothetical protein
LGTSFADERSRLHEVLEGLFDVLVIDIKLLFQGIQLCILKDLPPFAA